MCRFLREPPEVLDARVLLSKVCLSFVIVFFAANAQTPETPELARARADAERVRKLVEAGALPKKALAEAELVLGEASDEAILNRTLYGSVSLEEWTEEQAGSMIEAAERLAERQRTELDKARNLVRRKVLAESQLAPYEEELARREQTLALARDRAALFGELADIVRREEELARALEQAPETVPEIAERYDGSGVFLPSQMQVIRLEFERKFDEPFPVSANGSTALHRSLGFDHSGRVDVAVHPDSAEGQWLRGVLQELGVPYFAFRGAVAGKSTGSHIHIGPPSPRSKGSN